MKTMTIAVPGDTALPIADSDEEFARSLRLAAASCWYDRGIISLGEGGEIGRPRAGTPRGLLSQGSHKDLPGSVHSSFGG